MSDIMQRIDKTTDEILVDLMIRFQLKSKKEVISKCVEFCFVNKINFFGKNENFENLSSLNLYKTLKGVEFNIMKKLENLPFDFKKVIDADEEFHPFFENYDFIIKKYDAFLIEKKLMDTLLNSLSDAERVYFEFSRDRIKTY